MKASAIPPARTTDKPAFTLTELLVVIIIIAVLAALMFPMIRSMRSRADLTKCTANLRGWSVAIRGYADDHNQMVRYLDWEDIGSKTKYYNPYFGSESIPWPEKGRMGTAQGYYRMCPAQKWDGNNNPPAGYLFVRPNELNTSDKYARGEVDTDGDNVPDSYSLAKMSRPSRLLVMMDATEGKRIYRTNEFDLYVKPICDRSEKAKLRHGGGVNALFGDGHVDFLNWSDVNPAVTENKVKVTTWLNLN